MLHEVDDIPGQYGCQEELVRRHRNIRLEIVRTMVVQDVRPRVAVPELSSEPHAAVAGQAGLVLGAGGRLARRGLRRLPAPGPQPQQAQRARPVAKRTLLKPATLDTLQQLLS